jgi:hypothetical protein
MSGTNCDLFTRRSSRSYLNYLVQSNLFDAVEKLTSNWAAELFFREVSDSKLLT